MKTLTMVMISSMFLAAAAMHSGCASTESSQNTDESTVGVERTEEVATSGSSCPGVLIDHTPVTVGSTSGSLDVYFDNLTGNNCATMTATGQASGRASSILVCLRRCQETSPGPICTVDASQCDPSPSDPGPFHFFAGPVFVHATGQCINAFGHVTFNGVTVSADLSGASHCH